MCIMQLFVIIIMCVHVRLEDCVAFFSHAMEHYITALQGGYRLHVYVQVSSRMYHAIVHVYRYIPKLE